MRNLLLIFLTFPASAQAKPQVFHAVVLYTKPGWDSKFNNLEQLGIERAAEKKAYAACVGSGAADCVILEGAQITRCHFMNNMDSSGCEAEAYARGTAN